MVVAWLILSDCGLYDLDVCAYASALGGGGAPLRVLELDLHRVGGRGTLALASALSVGCCRRREGGFIVFPTTKEAPRIPVALEASCGFGAVEKILMHWGWEDDHLVVTTILRRESPCNAGGVDETLP